MISRTYKVLPGVGIQIRHKGLFNLNKLYSDMKKWFKDNGYYFSEKEQGIKDREKGREIKQKWEASREIDDYARFIIKVNFFFEDLNKVDHMDKGYVKITFFADVLLDYKEKWQTNGLYKFLFFVYNNYIIYHKIKEVYDVKLKQEVDGLHNLTKERLGLIK